MRNSVLLAVAAAAVAVVAGQSGASAQSVGVEVYTGNPYYYSDPYDRRYYRGERVYQYRDAEPGVVVRVPSRPVNCGVHRYWNGQRCADARINPPNLND